MGKKFKINKNNPIKLFCKLMNLNQLLYLKKENLYLINSNFEITNKIAR